MCWLSKHHVLDDLREVSQVELVMEFLSSWCELRCISDSQEDGHCSIYNLPSKLMILLIELPHVILKDLEVNRTQDILFSSQAGYQSEVSGKSKVNKEGT